MLARAGLLHHPVAQLAVGVGEIAEFAQRHEGSFDVFDAGLNDALLRRIVWRACIDPEAVPLGQRGVRALYLGIVHTPL